MYQFLSFLYSLPEIQSTFAFNPDSKESIDKAIQYMQDHLYNEIKLDNLSNYLNFSSPHFIRLFKAKTGLTPMKYYTRLKIEESASLLMSSDKTLAHIAEDLNFSSAAHFSKTFKQYLSISPMQYRNNYINTLEKRQDKYLEEIEKAYILLQNIIDSTPDIIFYKDINGIIMGCNNGLGEVLNISKEQIIGHSDHEIFPKDQAGFFHRKDQQVFDTKKAYKNVEWMIYQDGRKRKFEVYKAPFFDSQGNILGLIGISRDITDWEKR